MRDDIEFPSWWTPEALLLMLDIGIDEGGSQNILFISAQIGATKALRKLQTQWFLELAKYPSVSFFHSKDFYNYQSGQFKRLSATQRSILLAHLAKLIRKHCETGFTVRLDTKQYENRADAKFRSTWGSAYSFAIQVAMLGIRQFLDEKDRGQTPINMMIAAGHKNIGQVIQQNELIIRSETVNKILNIKSSGSGQMKDWPILQAADMLAYGTNRERNNDPEEIFAQLHTKRGYAPRFFDCTVEAMEDMIGTSNDFMAVRKALGQRVKRGE